MRSSARVLLLVENNAYPFDVRVRREATVLREGGYAVRVIAPRAPGQPWRESLDGVEVYRFPAPPGGQGIAGYALEFGWATLAMLVVSIWVALRRGFDIIHAANPPDTLFVIGAFFKPFGKRFVFDHHDLSPETYLSRFREPRPDRVYRVLRWMERCTFAVADLVIATNESYRRIAIERGRMSADRVFVVRNGPPRSYLPLPPDPALRERSASIVAYIGTMGPQDGVDGWLRIVDHLVRVLGRTDLLAIVIGSGDAMPALRAQAAELGIEPYLRFTGRIDDVQARTLLSTAAVCVQPDPRNPLNDCSTMNKVMEYMALGKPLVAFDLVETRFSAADAALYAQPDDESDFARKVAWLLDHPEQARRMGERGRCRVAESLAWEHWAPELLRAYEQGLGARPAPLSQVRASGG